MVYVVHHADSFACHWQINKFLRSRSRIFISLQVPLAYWPCSRHRDPGQRWRRQVQYGGEHWLKMRMRTRMGILVGPLRRTSTCQHVNGCAPKDWTPLLETKKLRETTPKTLADSDMKIVTLCHNNCDDDLDHHTQYDPASCNFWLYNICYLEQRWKNVIVSESCNDSQRDIYRYFSLQWSTKTTRVYTTSRCHCWPGRIFWRQVT